MNIIIKTTDGRELTIDFIDFIGFNTDGSVIIEGFKSGLNQTSDVFPVGTLKEIRFDQEHE